MSDDVQLLTFGRRGRPPRNGVRATKRVEFRLTPDEHEAVEQAARDNRMPVASLLRDALNTFVQDYGERVIFTPSGDKFPKRRD